MGHFTSQINLGKSLPSRTSETLDRVQSLYSKMLNDYEALRTALGPHTKQWPMVARVGSDKPANEYMWFCDYFGNAVQHVAYAVDAVSAGRSQPDAWRTAGEKLSLRFYEFKNLHSRILTEHHEGKLDDNQSLLALTALKDLEDDARATIGAIEEYRKDRKARPSR